MRALVLLFLSISVHAAEVRFFTEQAKVFNAQNAAVFVSGEGDVAFEISLNVDLRGRAIALQAHVGVAGRAPHLSSEIGEAVGVR
jgi:hypothetical protein